MQQACGCRETEQASNPLKNAYFKNDTSQDGTFMTQGGQSGLGKTEHKAGFGRTKTSVATATPRGNGSGVWSECGGHQVKYHLMTGVLFEATSI